ncbi:hypothetical protein [Nonomuraea sp. NPDC049480]|uniref:hypothetical protein n=1 Tax=Nonomuraea sp. NPDC049480 TaxID=3364353 RepID=UPI0037B8C557
MNEHPAGKAELLRPAQSGNAGTGRDRTVVLPPQIGLLAQAVVQIGLQQEHHFVRTRVWWAVFSGRTTAVCVIPPVHSLCGAGLRT